MPDYIEPISAPQGQNDWPAMLHDLEKRVEVLSDALEGVKLSMRRLVLAEPWLEEAIASHATEQPHQSAHMAPAALLEREQPVAYEAPAAGDEPQFASYHFDEPVADDLPVEYNADAREAVRQAVEDAKAQMVSEGWHDETPDYVTEDKPEVSWVTVPDDGSAPEPLPTFDEVPDASVDEEDAREAVRRAVEQAKAELSPISEAPAVPTNADESAREAVRRTVEQAKGGLGFGWGSAMPSTPQDKDQPREAFSQSFLQASVNASDSHGEEPAATVEVETEEAAREAVRMAVEQAKADMASAGQVPGSEPLDDEESAREAVRKAVMQARTEMATTGSLSQDVPEPTLVSPAFVVPPPHRPERVHPPTITIEDPEGRVELARVYNLLKALDCAANSSLLNYSSRQVSVQLSDSKHAPNGENVGEAVRDVFERENDVSVDGLNVIVKLGDDYTKAA